MYQCILKLQHHSKFEKCVLIEVREFCLIQKQQNLSLTLKKKKKPQNRKLSNPSNIVIRHFISSALQNEWSYIANAYETTCLQKERYRQQGINQSGYKTIFKVIGLCVTQVVNFGGKVENQYSICHLQVFVKENESWVTYYPHPVGCH